MVAKLTSPTFRRVRHGVVALALGMTAFSSGCKLLDTDSSDCKQCEKQTPPPPPATVPGQLPKDICSYWEHKLVMAPDPLHEGQPVPGLLGRMFVFDQGEHMALFEGAVEIDLYDERPVQGGPPVRLEQWKLNKEALKKLAHKDTIGWGYTLFLPTVTCNPYVTHIRLAVKFTPEVGTPMLTSASTLRIEHPDMRPNPGMIPAGYRPQQSMLPPQGYQPGVAPAGYAPQQQPMAYGNGPQQQFPQQPMMPQPQYPGMQQSQPVQQPQYQGMQPPQYPGMQQPQQVQPVQQPQYQGMQPPQQPQYQGMQPPQQPQYQSAPQQYQGGSQQQPQQPMTPPAPFQGGGQQLQRYPQ